MRICVAGKNQIAVDAVDHLLDQGLVRPDHLVVIGNRTDDGTDDWQPSLRAHASRRGLKEVRATTLHDDPELVFLSLEFDRLIRPDRWATHRLYNIHFSLLPAYKGMYTSVWPLLNGDREGGVTLHRIDAGIDTGDLLSQRRFPIDLHDTCRDLYFKYLAHGAELFRHSIEALLRGEIDPTPQPAQGASYFSRDALDFGDLRIDLEKTSFEIHNQLRAFIFPEYQLPVVRGHRVASTRLTDVRIAPRTFTVEGAQLTLSGIDGYRIDATLA